MRNNRNDNRNNYERENEPRWLHEQDHGENSRRGNYRIDSHFNRGYGEQDDDFRDETSFNTNTDQGYTTRQGRYQVGGATYMGEDFTRNSNSDNPYGMSYTRDDGYNSGRHYDSRADYSDRDYNDLRENNRPRDRYGLADERFGHDITRGEGRDSNYLGHSSRGDYESYRRYEQGNRNYDNDYRGGFAGRNYTDNQHQFGEDRNYSNRERWNEGNDQRQDRSRDRR